MRKPIVINPVRSIPCKDCVNRCYNCHSFCQQYINYKKEAEKARPDWKSNDIVCSLIKNKRADV